MKNIDTIIKEFYKKHYNGQISRLKNRGLTQEDAEDVIQDALIKFARNYNYKKSSWKTFLSVLITNELCVFIRKQKNSLSVPPSKIVSLDLFMEHSDIQDYSLNIDKIIETEQVISELPDIVFDYYFSNMTKEEIATKYGINVKSLRQVVSLLKKKLDTEN